MSYIFSDMQTDVKARATLSESSNDYDTQVKNAINTSLTRVARAALWKQLRRRYEFDTVEEYTTGSGAVAATEDSASVTVTGATFITDGVVPGRYITIESGGTPYIVDTITGETTLTLNKAYSDSTTTTGTYQIYGQGDYVCPINTKRIAFLWHEAYGYPYVMHYASDFDYYGSGNSQLDNNIPVVWKLWEFTSALAQPLEASALALTSSSSSDQNISVTVYGTVSGYPDQETIITNSSNGTTSVSGSKQFTYITRVVKNASTVGRLTLTANSTNVTVAVLPVGDTLGSVLWPKIGIHPFPDRVFPINVMYYEDVTRMVNDGDIHILGSDFDECIMLGAIVRLNYGQSKKSGDDALKLYLDELRSLKSVNADTVTTLMRTMKPANIGAFGRGNRPHTYLNYTQLGGYYGPRVK